MRAVITDYIHAHPDEKTALAPALDLLAGGADLTSRKEFRGHATAGAVLVDGGQALFIEHAALGRWLLPGGHLEADDPDLMGGALRELAEETGISAGVTPVSPVPVHIDVHSIPANAAKGEPRHQHVDFRYLFRATAGSDVTLQAEEVSGFAWRGLDTIGDARLRNRVRAAFR
ncbi:NUDIX hydrolase [Streptomyces varsoviensis]|uniref:NUDIX hydrolase n=1 Tax=Streptomyces varsoviensis TaxID=67373 RepID=A0ABR5JE13_9ACTN|nr:NUDIX domain-containing protein [Streptomyces varsoviensis]KOG91684.1 NUDIX hydrolase [Streptomyces varsoviensis]